jgi:hypothetical protein
MGVIVPFPKVYRPHPPPECEPLDALQGEIREALADAVALTDVLAEALALADDIAETTREHEPWAS